MCQAGESGSLPCPSRSFTYLLFWRTGAGTVPGSSSCLELELEYFGVWCRFFFSRALVGHNNYLEYRKEIGHLGVYPRLLPPFGVGPNAPAERPPASPNRPQTQFRSPGEMPEAHAKHAYKFLFVSGTSLGLTGQRRTRGQTKPPFWPHVGGGITPCTYLMYLLSP